MTAVAPVQLGHSRLPVIRTGGIYEGKIRDSTPSLRPAGKLTATGDTAATCLQPPKDGRPPSPDVIRKFRASAQPEAGRARVFYGRANDPHRTWAKEMIHGARIQPSFIAGDLVNPPLQTLFKTKIVDKKEGHYASHQKGPLGRSHDQTPGFPADFPRDRITYGIKTVKDGCAGELVNPAIDHLTVMANNEVGLELYKQTHFDYHPGEQKTRRYNTSGYDSKKLMGMPTPHDNTGKQTRKSMHWLHDDLNDKRTPICSRRADEFRERTQHVLGKTLDPIKDTMNVSPDHTFGILLKPDKYGAGDLMHYRLPDDYLRGKDRMRGVVAAMQNQLKKQNFHNFPVLINAFRHYDKNGTGKIDKNALREVCIEYGLPADEELLEGVIAACNPDHNTGEIDYISFINFLNWKDKMPSDFPERNIQSAPSSNQQPLADRRSPPLTAQIDPNVNDHRTSSARIASTVGGVSNQGFRTYGIPTVRTDIAAPRLRRVSDRVNYGDEGNSGALLNPNIFYQRGVHERHFFEPRSRTQIREIFANIGVDMPMDTFDRLFDMAASLHPQGMVTVEGFRNVLDQAQGQYVEQEQEKANRPPPQHYVSK